MASIFGLRVTWSGDGVVGPGVSTFYTRGLGSSLATGVVTYFNALKPLLPQSPSVVLSIPAGGEELDEETGAFLGVWGSTTPTTVQGTGTSPSFAHGVGIRCVWQTDGTTGRRRVRGTTFLVPVTAPILELGTIAENTRSQVVTAGENLITAAPGFCIWTRPKNGAGGKTSLVTGAECPDRVSWLKSRKY